MHKAHYKSIIVISAVVIFVIIIIITIIIITIIIIIIIIIYLGYKEKLSSLKKNLLLRFHFF